MRTFRSTFEIDALLRCVARRQLGLVTVAQANRIGADKHALARRRDAGALVPVFTNVMRLASVATTPPQRALAAGLAIDGATIAGTSAAIVHQLPLPARLVANPATEAVVTVGAQRIVRVDGIRAVRQTVEWPKHRWMSAYVTTPAATIVLLPRFVDDDIVERCLDHCLAHRLTTIEAIADVLQRVPASAVRRRKLLLTLINDRSSGVGHRSKLEQSVARWLQACGISGWQRNLKVDVGGGVRVEVDFGWPQDKIALEVSPFFTHGSRATQERDAERRRLLVSAGWRVVEATDADLQSARSFARVVAALTALLGEAGV